MSLRPFRFRVDGEPKLATPEELKRALQALDRYRDRFAAVLEERRQELSAFPEFWRECGK